MRLQQRPSTAATWGAFVLGCAFGALVALCLIFVLLLEGCGDAPPPEYDAGDFALVTCALDGRDGGACVYDCAGLAFGVGYTPGPGEACASSVCLEVRADGAWDWCDGLAP